MKNQILNLLFALILSFGARAETLSSVGTNSSARQAAPRISFDQIGALAGKQYSGDGLAVTADPEGARLRCVFQKLNARVTTEGLWLNSAADRSTGQPFRIAASKLGRGQAAILSQTGEVKVAGQVVQFVRLGLTEEYSAGVDGLKQDFVIENRPAGSGLVRLELAITGAQASAQGHDIRLALADNGRQLLYHQLRAEDARGRSVSARFEMVSPTRLAIVLEDSSAEYPVRIDPTFSDANWVSLGGVAGVDGKIYCTVADGAGNIYVGGSFSVAGNVVAQNIAEWNGSSWSALGAGMNSFVFALAESGTNLYAGGQFTMADGLPAKHIAQWNGSAWSPVGTGVGDNVSLVPGMGDNVFALAISGTNLYAGGRFVSAGGAPANHIAQWNGSAWSALGPGVSDSVYALEVSGTNLYAGGFFTSAGGAPANYVALWSGSAWSALGSGVGGGVLALAVSGTNVYAGGGFGSAGSVSANNVALWNGSTWSALGAGVDNGVAALLISGTNLYVGGIFANAGGMPDAGVALWNGNSWSNVGLDYLNNGIVYALVTSGGSLYAGGRFGIGFRGSSSGIARWDGTNWLALSPGGDGVIYALAVSGNNLYVGGYFDRLGSAAANCVAQWNGTNWLALGSGISGISVWGGSFVDALTVLGNNLYAGGSFTAADGMPATNIAQWNGSAWSSLGSGMSYTVSALAVVGTNLYAGTSYPPFGSHIAQWNGIFWSALGSGLNDVVFALAVSGTNLYVGGQFTSAGGVAANAIAEWNGNLWSALGSGIGGTVAALVVSGTNVYAGGQFSTAGGVPANNVAEWSGGAWSALGSGISGSIPIYNAPDPEGWSLGPSVYALAVVGNNLYAGGSFSLAGGVSANDIAQWDGTAWSPMGAGMNNPVRAFEVSGNNLFAGGDFSIAGTNGAGYLVEAILGPEAPVICTKPLPQYLLAGGNAAFTVNSAGAPPLAYQWFFDGNAITNAIGSTLTITNVGPGQTGNYSVVITNTYGSITSSIVPLTIILSPAFSQTSLGANGSPTLNLLTTTNVPSRVYTASNLSPPVIWLPIYTNLYGGVWQFTDTNTGSARTKCYRLSTP